MLPMDPMPLEVRAVAWSLLLSCRKEDIDGSYCLVSGLGLATRPRAPYRRS
jgi:hypothetical protein